MAENGWLFVTFDPKSFVPPARKVTRVFLHCTDCDNDNLRGVGLAAEINRWHLMNGWAGIGYHFVIDKHGVVATGRSLEKIPAAQLGPDGLGNIATIAISTHGSRQWTAEELLATRNLCAAINTAYLPTVPVTFWGHTELDPRPCPIYRWGALLGLDENRRFGAVPFQDPAVIAAQASTGVWPKLNIVDAHTS